MRALLALASIALVPSLALARPGSVDWERRVVLCGGTGPPNLREAAGLVAVTRAGTERAAKREALRDCLAALRGISIGTGRTVGQALSGDAGLTRSVEAVVKRFRSAGELRFFSDGGVELRVEVPLDGDIAEMLLPAPSLDGQVPGERAAGAATAVTGVLVDASGEAVAHALAPRILDEAGGEVYGPSMLTARARRGGTATYATDAASARQAFAARLGAAPRVVKATGALGPDVVVSDADAAAIRGAACLAEGRVVIITRAQP